MLQEMGDSHTALPVGWKKPNNKFVFGLYPTREEAYNSIFSMQNGRRQAYEVIADKPCHLYFDLEWEAAQDEGHEKIRAFIQTLSQCCRQFYEVEVSPIVLCDTRRLTDSEQWKNSYHVHVREIIYKNNYDSDIKFFVREVLNELNSPDWFWTSKSGKQTHFVDVCVYRKYGLFRFAGCGKNLSCLQELNLENGLMNMSISVDTWLKCLVSTSGEGVVPTVGDCKLVVHK